MRFYFVSFQTSIYAPDGNITASLGSRVMHREKPISSPDDINEMENELRDKFMTDLKPMFGMSVMTVSILNWRRMEDAE
jgi:hypothetical protein